MKLTPDEYRRGLVKWNPSASIEVRTSASDDPDAATVWSDPVSDPTGSKVPSPPGGHINLSFRMTGAGEPPFPVRWDRLASAGAVQVIIMDPDPHEGRYIQLAHISNYGIFHRLVVEATRTLTWESDAVLRVNDVIVRLVTGKITGERVSPLDEAQAEAGVVTLTSGKSGTVELDGRFIEIVAPGDSEASAELNASSILGLLALVFGASAAGDVVFSESYVARPGEPQRGQYRFPITKQLPSEVENTGLDAVDQILSDLLDAESMKRALRLALHWFERGLRSRTPLDELICYFVGIETILNTYASVHGPIPEVEQRKKDYGSKLKALLTGEVDPEVIGRLQNSLGFASVRERFSFYVGARELEHRSVSKFDSLVEARNRAFHGQPADAAPQVAADAAGLLIAILKLELGLEIELPWDVGPNLISSTLYWDFAEYGFHRHRPTSD